jgi:hypothetical protein
MYGALRYDNSCNLGDNIQTLAAIKFLPKVDCWIDRDSGECDNKNSKIVVIYNGWFNENFWNTIPSNITPIFQSFHLQHDTHEDDESYAFLVKNFRIPRNEKNFTFMNGEVGCRDEYTVSYLKEKGINAYFSGCLTLTMTPPPNIDKNDKVLLVDVEFFPWLAGISTITATQISSSKMTDNEGKLKEAENLLRKIAASRVVVTTRLHTTLPAIAFKVPVIFVTKNINDVRFKGLIDETLLPITDGSFCPVDINTFDWNVMSAKYRISHFEKLSENLKKRVNLGLELKK